MDAIHEEEARKKRSDQMRKQRSAVSTDMECQQRPEVTCSYCCSCLQCQCVIYYAPCIDLTIDQIYLQNRRFLTLSVSVQKTQSTDLRISTATTIHLLHVMHP